MRGTSVWLKYGRKATTPALHGWMEMGVAAKVLVLTGID